METISETIDNGEVEVNVAPVGEFYGSDSAGNPVPERLTEESLQKLADNLNEKGAEILCDADHASCREGLNRDTSAAGWLSNFFIKPLRGLWARMKLTSKGRDLVENRVFRYLSPVFELGEDGQPVGMPSVALTNCPALAPDIAPVINQEPTEDNSTKGLENMSKDELKQILKEAILEIRAEKEAAEKEAAEKEAAEVENAEPEKAEDKPEEKPACNEAPEEEKPAEPAAEDKPAEEEKPEEPAEKKEEEVIPLASLNSAPHVKIDSSEEWRSLNGKAFWDWLNSHPDALRR